MMKKVKIRGEFKLEQDIYMLIWETVTKLPIDKYIESFAYFTLENNEIVIKIDTDEKNSEIIKWNDYMKYRMAKLDKKNIKSWYEENIEDFSDNRFGYKVN